MSDQKDSVWVIAEQIRGEIPVICIEIIGQARKLADELEVPVEVILLGKDISDQLNLFFFAGADVVHLGNAADFEIYQADIFTETIVSLAKERHPQIMLIGSTFMGRELAPLIAANLGTGLTAHCIDLVLDDNGILEQQVPAYGGILSIICPEKRPQIATVARGVFPMPALDENRSGIILPIEPLEGKDIRLEIQALAEILNAALGSTRPAVDEGWTELETMIGQSGRIVSPEIYIGVGISGELQHMVGIVGAKVMIAINNDPKSPVFEQVDYGIVEDCRVFLPALVDKLKNIKEFGGRAAHVV
jgi:electron transfer flavoprotein alpha subunit